MGALRPRPVPSAGLLRFMRAQFDDMAFFAQNHRSSTCLSRAPRSVSCLPRRNARSLGASHSDSLPESAQLKAGLGLFDTNFLLRPNTPASASAARAGAVRSRQPQLLSRTDSPMGLRHSSSDHTPTPCKQSWSERIWGTRARKPAKPLEPDDLPHKSGDGEHNSMFNNRRQLSQKAALEPRLRCTEVDESGNVILVDSEFKKSELIARFGLLPRDLRKIDSSNLPHILVRPTAILLNLLHLKVLIKYNRVLLFDVYGSKASYPQSAFMYDLQGKLQQKQPAVNGSLGGLPYEFRALEAVLQSVTQELEADFEAVRDPVIRILSELEDDIDRHKLRILLILSKRVSTFEQKAKLVRDAIEEILETDDDLAAMYLTEKTHDLFRGADDHTEVEMLLESYHKLCDEIVQEAGNLVSSIRNTEEIIRAILDANRNSLMLLDLKFSVGTLGLAMGTFIAGLYGMNLENFIEETDWGMGAVTAVSIICSLWVCRYGLNKLAKVQRIKMQQGGVSGSGGLTSTGRLGQHEYHWFHDEGMLDPRNREQLRRLNMRKAASDGTNGGGNSGGGKKSRWW